MTRSLRLPLHILFAFGLFLAACGDDDSSSESGDAGDDTSGEVDDAAEEAAEDAAEDALESAAGGECGFLAEFAGAFDDLDFTTALSGGESIDFGALFASVAEEFQEVADAAPDEIEDAFQTMADGVSDAASALEGIELDFSDPQNVDPEALAALESLDAEFDEEFDAAADEVDAWVQANCSDLAGDIDLDGIGGGFGG